MQVSLEIIPLSRKVQLNANMVQDGSDIVVEAPIARGRGVVSDPWSTTASL